MRKNKALSTILILLIGFLIFFFTPHFQIKVITGIIAGILLLYILMPVDEELQEEYKDAVISRKSPDVELKEEIIASIERKMSHSDPQQKVAVIVQPMLVVSDTEFNEKTDNMKNNIEKTELPKVEAKPKKPQGVTSYSITGVHIRYRKMFDDFHSFAVNHGPQTEEALVQKLAPYGYPYKIERQGDLVAFNLGFIRMPRQGFFSTAE